MLKLVAQLSSVSSLRIIRLWSCAFLYHSWTSSTSTKNGLCSGNLSLLYCFFNATFYVVGKKERDKLISLAIIEI